MKHVPEGHSYFSETYLPHTLKEPLLEVKIPNLASSLESPGCRTPPLPGYHPSRLEPADLRASGPGELAARVRAVGGGVRVTVRLRVAVRRTTRRRVLAAAADPGRRVLYK